jgi:transposase
VISGIVHMLRSGARWRDCSPEYGPYTTIYNRFNRWSRQGIWLDMFEALTGSTSLFGAVSIDSSHAKAHRSAAGGKGGTSNKPSGARAGAARRRSTH